MHLYQYQYEKIAQLKKLHMEPIYLVPLKKLASRRGWYIARSLAEGLDLYRCGCGYISYEDIGTLYDVFVLDDFKLKALKGVTQNGNKK